MSRSFYHSKTEVTAVQVAETNLLGLILIEIFHCDLGRHHVFLVEILQGGHLFFFRSVYLG